MAIVGERRRKETRVGGHQRTTIVGGREREKKRGGVSGEVTERQ